MSRSASGVRGVYLATVGPQELLLGMDAVFGNCSAAQGPNSTIIQEPHTMSSTIIQEPHTIIQEPHAINTSAISTISTSHSPFHTPLVPSITTSLQPDAANLLLVQDVSFTHLGVHQWTTNLKAP